MSKRRPVLLLVEADPDQELLITLALEGSDLGARVRTLRSGEMALRYLHRLPPFTDLNENPEPALVLLNLMLPGMSGFDVLRSIRESADLKALPVLILTVYEESPDRRRAAQLGATAFQEKPADPLLLVPIVRDLLGRSQERAAG